MIGIVDYGVGNLRNVLKAIERQGKECQISSSYKNLEKSSSLILPGVGAFGDAMGMLISSGLREFVDDWVHNERLILGICVGMQLLFERSYEFGIHKGLGYLKGDVRMFQSTVLKVPHIGWNELEICKQSPLLKNINNGDYVYFVHSFYADSDTNDILATTSYGVDAAAVVGSGNTFGVQFHPEKSSHIGAQILANFLEMDEEYSKILP